MNPSDLIKKNIEIPEMKFKRNPDSPTKKKRKRNARRIIEKD